MNLRKRPGLEPTGSLDSPAGKRLAIPAHRLLRSILQFDAAPLARSILVLS